MFAYSNLNLMARSTLAAFALALAATSSWAQSITVAPHSTNTAIIHNGNTYTIDGGTQTGTNLFHSFGEFGLTPQETAHFLSHPSIRNVLGRVVGGNPSTIEGLIRLSGGHSNLYLMNPAGIVFGQGARLDLPGSFTATTATRIGFADGFFNAVGENDYAALNGNPTGFVFDTTTGSIFNQGTLAVAEGESLWLVGSSVLNTGTLKAPGGDITIAAIPGQHQIRIRQDNMLLTLVVDALPVDAGEETGQAGTSESVEATEPIGLQPTDLPRYLTGGSDLGNANTVTLAADGTMYLSSNGVSKEFQTGDVGITGTIEAETVQLMAAGQVTATDPAQVQGKTTVVRFPGETDAFSYNFIDGLIDDPNLFLYGGEAGSISTLVSSQENGIDVITARLADLTQDGIQLDGLRIVSEGNEGNFWLGNAWVTDETIDNYAGQLATWSGALTESADILLYSCFTALGETGEVLVSSLADMTGADVAASTTLTGSAALGGDWTLERQTGSIELGSGFEPAVTENFAGTLAVFTATDATSLIAAINTANGNGAADTINLSGNITLTAINNVVDGDNGLPSITAAETLTINGMGNTLSRDGAAPDFRLLHIALGAELEISDTTVSGGVARAGGAYGDDGGGIFNRGTLTLTGSTVSGHIADGNGGGIASVGTNTNAANMTLTGSTVSGNLANGNGGGIASVGTDTNAANITLTNSTISGNTAGGNGGGVSNRAFDVFLGPAATDGAEITIVNSTISGNSAGGSGGGLSNQGTALTAATASVTLTNSTIAGNTAGGSGGGLHNQGNNDTDAAKMTLIGSTVSGNLAGGDGGGISNSGIAVSNAAQTTLANSTVSGNTAIGNGGGLYNQGIGGAVTNIAEMTLTNSTVSANMADNGGGVFTSAVFLPDQATLTVGNSIIAGNTGTTLNPDVGRLIGAETIIDQGNNLIGIDATGAFTTSTLVGSATIPLDARLLPLADNGGPTQTHALSADSPALNAGSDALAAGLTTDQRGFNRFNGTVDIGAFELQDDSLTGAAGAGQDTDLEGVTFLSNSGFTDSASIAQTILPRENAPAPLDTGSERSGLSGCMLDTGVDALENSYTTEFETHLGAADGSRKNLADACNALGAVASSGVKPALLYVNFVPSLEGSDAVPAVAPEQDLEANEKAIGSKQEAATARPKSLPLPAEGADILWQFPSQGMAVERSLEGQGQQQQQEMERDSDQLELVLVTPQGTIRKRVLGATRSAVRQMAMRLRRQVNDPLRVGSRGYLGPAQQFYQWLIAPVEAELQAQEIDNLVFIMDAGLRSLPVAVLHDGEDFAIARYSLGLMPSLSLTDTRQVDITNFQVLAMGASEFSDQAPLAAVPVELAAIAGQIWPGKSVLNQDFTPRNLQRIRRTRPFGIVHLATHADFLADRPDRSYIQFFNQRVSFDQMHQTRLFGPNVELLVLSACKTAIGDEEAELGFAGLAVQTGVKSALGSLWYVSDEGTLGFMTSFYEQLKQAPIKAEALRQTQLAMSRGEVRLVNGELVTPGGTFPLPSSLSQSGDRALSHPFYWSAFTLVGNPW